MLLLFSISAFGKAQHAARQGREMDIPASFVIQNIGNSVLKSVIKIASIPSETLIAISVAVSNIILYPFHATRDLISKIKTIACAAFAKFHVTAMKVVASPHKAVEVSHALYLSAKQWASQSILTVLNYIASLPRTIFFVLKDRAFSLAHCLGSKSKSWFSMIYHLAEYRTMHLLCSMREVVSIDMLRITHSFSIIYANFLAWVKKQSFVVNDKIEDLMQGIRPKMLYLFGRGG